MENIKLNMDFDTALGTVQVQLELGEQDPPMTAPTTEQVGKLLATASAHASVIAKELGIGKPEVRMQVQQQGEGQGDRDPLAPGSGGPTHREDADAHLIGTMRPSRCW